MKEPTRRAVLAGAASVAAFPRATHAAPACGGRIGGVPAARVALLARGFNLTGWLDRKPAAPPSRAVLQALRARGFTHVRLPVKAEFHLPDFAGTEAAAAQARALQSALDLLLRLDFAVSLDMHPGEEIGALRARDPGAAFRHIEALWTRLARSVADHGPERVFFELLNEPTDAEEFARVVTLAASVRSAAPHHTLIVGPPQWQRVEALEAMTPLPDRNVVYAVHFYDPMAFTHQGLDWAGPEEPLTHFRGVPFPSGPSHPAVLALKARLARDGHGGAARALAEQLAERWDEARIADGFARVGVWASRHDAPVIVNEFGVLAWQAPPADRARWIRAVRQAAEAHCIGWTHWDYADGFGLAKRAIEVETLDPAIVDALVGPDRRFGPNRRAGPKP